MLVQVYANESCRLNLLILVCGWPKPDGRAVAIKNRTLYREDETGRLHSVEVETDEQLEAIIVKYYPALGRDTVHRAVGIWSALPPYDDVRFP